MNVTIEIKKIYFVEKDGILVDWWYSEQCANDWTKVYGGNVVVYEQINQIVVVK